MVAAGLVWRQAMWRATTMVMTAFSLAACVGRTGSTPPAAVAPTPLPDGAHVELVDVAVVWPLPAGTGPGNTHLGPLLTCEQQLVFEPLTRSDEPEDLCASLTVTAVRLDPCARDSLDGACRPELRVVLQPVFDGEARDAAIHAFYDVNLDDLSMAATALMRLRLDRGLDGRGPLGVHPVLTDSDGLDDVKAVVSTLLDQSQLRKFTQITVHGDNSAWSFSLREFVDGEVTGGDASVQHVLSSSPDAIDIRVTPPSVSADDFAVLLRTDGLAAATLAEQQTAFDHAARVEHPLLNDTSTIDCAACHTAAPARAATSARFAASGDVLSDDERFTSEHHDLSSSAVFNNPQFIHALAWRVRDLAINQRVVNEAAVSADLLHTHLVEQGIIR